MIDGQSLVGKEISGCEILTKVAEGGMGAVFKARHKALNRIVCVKILSPALANDKKAVTLFLTEARAIAELDHPNIVNVYNVGKEQGYYFIVMSFIEGQTLSAILKKQRVLPIGWVLDLFDGVLQGLSVAHEKGIIHRDIKPSNILITPEGKPKIVDFGIAKKIDKEKGSTKTTELAGTAYFIAPEQALGRDIDTRADLYSIGASMYYVLTGHFPYNGKNTIEIIQKHINDPVPNPAALRPDLPGWLALAIQKLMSKKPEDRFQSAKETYTYFNKMRAEEQLRVKTMHGRAAIDLGVEGPLKIANETRVDADSLKKLRAQDVYRKLATSSGPRNAGPQQAANMPTLDDLAATLPPVEQNAPQTGDPAPVQELKPQPAAKPIEETTRMALQTLKAKQYLKTALYLAVLLPLFALFAFGVGYVWFTLGKICSGHLTADTGFLAALMAPFSGGYNDGNQLIFTVLALIALISVFAVSSIKAYSKTTAIMLALSAAAYLAGLFTPQVPLFDASHIQEYLFSPQYYLCYLVIAAAWTLSLCVRWSRSWPERFLSAALVLLCAVLVYRGTALTLLPDMASSSAKLIFSTGLLMTVLSIYFLALKPGRAILRPLVCFLIGLGCLWFYNVSGLVYQLKTTVQTLVDVIPMEEPTAQQKSSLPEENYYQVNRPAMLTRFASSKAVNYLNPEEKQKFLEEAIEKYTGPLIEPAYYPLLTSLLATYYLNGPSKASLKIWDYAVSYPFQSFNQNAQHNNAYYFLLMILFLMALLNCAGGILFKEDL